MKATLIFPHQLFQNHPAIQPGHAVFLVEHALFFSQYAFHKQKLVLHRASMKAYQHELQRTGAEVVYVEFGDAALENLLKSLHMQGFREVHYAEVADDYLQKDLLRAAKTAGLTAHVVDSPNFLTTPAEFDRFMRGEKRYLMANFYIWQRKRLGLLLTPEGGPLGGQWSFDAENRERVPKGLPIPKAAAPSPNRFVAEAIEYVNRHFANNYGTTTGFAYPTTAAEAQACLDDFLENRLADFGAYEDAMVQAEPVLFHSVLSPALNIGLVSPSQIVTRTLEFHARKNYPLNSLEGFVRQIIGWREFIRGVYHREGVRQRTTNFLRHERPLPASFYNGTTGIVPVDHAIRQTLATGYCHHIERLMVLGNFMHLCDFHPDAVYQWFMELFIDAYDWVMVPNVYGMTQYADGGLMTTKPYVSGSNYILKMSDYKTGDWCATWDGLYWRYVLAHQELFKKNPRMRMITSVAQKMNATKRAQHLANADEFLAALQ
jgi:deoxyribodipyrimidine photolyase-related protein